MGLERAGASHRPTPRPGLGPLAGPEPWPRGWRPVTCHRTRAPDGSPSWEKGGASARVHKGATSTGRLGGHQSPPTHCWQAAGRPRLSWATPKRATAPDTGRGRVGGPPGRRSRTADPRPEGGQPHTGATQPRATQGHGAASHPSWGGGAGRRQGSEKTMANGTLGCQDIRGLRHQSLSPDSTQGHQSTLRAPAASLPQGPLSAG